MKGKTHGQHQKSKKITLTGSKGKKPNGKRKRSNSQGGGEPQAKRMKKEEKKDLINGRPQKRSDELKVTEDDVKFFEEHGQYIQFLDNMKEEELHDQKKKKKYQDDELDLDSEDEDGVMESRYEMSRQQKKVSKEEQRDKRKLLPVRGENDELEDRELDSDEEAAKSERKEKREEEKRERLREKAREKRQKEKERKKLKRKRQQEEDGEDEEQESSSSSDESSSPTIGEEEENDDINSNKQQPSSKSAKTVGGFEDEADLDDQMLELKLFMQRQNQISKQKEKMAALASSVLEDPERNMRKFKDLIEFCNSDDVTVRKLAILSVSKVFDDIIPSYRIVIGADEGVQLSKEVKKLRIFEKSILDTYQEFLQILEELIHHMKEILKAQKEEEWKQQQQNPNEVETENSTSQPKMPSKWRRSKVDLSNMNQSGINAMLGLGKLATKAIGQLLSRHSHFNFRSNIITVLVPLLNSADLPLSDIVVQSLADLFKNDKKGGPTLETVREISQLIKQKNFKIRPNVIKVFHHLNLKKPLEDGESIFFASSKSSQEKNAAHRHQNDQNHLSKKEKKNLKQQKLVEDELKETEAVESKKDRSLMQTETLKAVFLIFFRFLKHTKRSPVLTEVLECLAKFSHLINLDLLLNIVELLKLIIVDPHLPLLSCMYTVITAFQAIKLQGDTLTVDLKDFYNLFYKLLEPVTASPSQYSQLIPLLIRALDLMINQRRHLAQDRVAAYAKKLLSISLHLPHQAAIALLMLVNQIFKHYPKCQNLLDTEFSGTGIYRPEIEDPEHCNIFAATAWEFSLLYEHVHPSVVNLVKLIISQEAIPEHDINSLFQKFEFAKHGIVPSMTHPRPHVFKKSINKAEKAGRNNLYFIQPSSSSGKTDFAISIESRRMEIQSNLNKRMNNARASESRSQLDSDDKRHHPSLLFSSHFEDLQSLMDIDYAEEDPDNITSDEEKAD